VLYADGDAIVRRGWEVPDSPHPHVMLLGQHYTERFLAERLTELDAEVSWETELLDFTTRQEMVSAHVRQADGAEAHIEAAISLVAMAAIAPIR